METNTNITNDVLETVTEEVTTNMNGVLKYGLIGVASVAVGYVTYRYVAKPLIRKFKKSPDFIVVDDDSETIE